MTAFWSADIVSQYANIKDDSLLVLGNTVYRKGNYAESEAIYREALKKYGGDKKSKESIIASVGLGASLLDQSELLAGKEWIFRADSSISDQIPYELQAYVKSNVGWVYKRFREYTKAYSSYNLALSLAEQSGDQYRIAQVSNSLSLLAYYLGYYDEAITSATIAVKSFEQLDDPFLLSMAYSNLSSAFEALGFIEKAEENLIKSFNLKLQLQNQDLISNGYFYLGSFYHRTGNFDKALSNYSKYLNYVLDLGSMSFITPAYDYVGSVYLSMGDYEKALEYFSRSEELDNKHNLQSNTSVLLKIAFCYQKMGEYELARTLYLTALDKFIEKNDRHQIIETYLKLSELELTLENFNEALSFAEVASNRSLETESKQLKAGSYAALGKVNVALGNKDLALRLSKKAYDLASIFKGYNLATYAANLATAFYHAGNDSAFFFAEIAFSEIEREQQSVYGDNLESGVFSNYANFYDEVAFWYLDKQNNVEKAFEVTERGRARVLLERLSVSESELRNVVTEKELISLRQKEKEIDKVYRQIEHSDNDNDISQLKNQLRDLEFNYQSYSNDLRLQYPQLKTFTELELISIPEIQEMLSSNEALIEYIITDNRLVTIQITKKDAVSHSIALDSVSSTGADISSLVSNFRTSIQEKASLDVLEKQSDPLYNILLKPFINRLHNIDHLIIVPVKSLSVLPFDALYINNSFLVERFNIKYLPSSSIYNYIKPAHRSTTKELFAVAGSGFSNSISTTRNYSSLPSTLLEVDAISDEFNSFISLKDRDVSESNIKNASLHQFRYLHFATHGKVNELNPQQSGLIISELNEQEGPFQEDGYLNSKEISSLNLNADMVVLSACNTAIGKIVSGEGLQGLQRSFFKAGASSVVVSLWNVYDKSTASFMGAFYQNLNRFEKEEIGIWNKLKIAFDFYEPPMFGYKEKALHQAKLEFLDHPYYNDPVYWAPFIMLGK